MRSGSSRYKGARSNSNSMRSSTDRKPCRWKSRTKSCRHYRSRRNSRSECRSREKFRKRKPPHGSQCRRGRASRWKKARTANPNAWRKRAIGNRHGKLISPKNTPSNKRTCTARESRNSAKYRIPLAMSPSKSRARAPWSRKRRQCRKGLTRRIRNRTRRHRRRRKSCRKNMTR